MTLIFWKRPSPAQQVTETNSLKTIRVPRVKISEATKREQADTSGVLRRVRETVEHNRLL